MISETVERSESLHQRVRAFVRGASRESGESAETFEELALAIARFQAENSPGYRNLVERSGRNLERAEEIPAVPSETFRWTRVAVHPEELDAVRFTTSGTSAEQRGVHVMRTTATYELLSVEFGRRALVCGKDPVVVAFAQAPSEPVGSSLTFMLREFMRHLDPDGLEGESSQRPRDRWLLSEEGVDVRALEQLLGFAHEGQRPLLILSTSLALAQLLEQLGTRRLSLPRSSVVMHTGGPKRRGSDLDLSTLRARVAETFQLPLGQVVGEYGMTELSSQLYEATAEGSELSAQVAGSSGQSSRQAPGIFIAPRWLRVDPVDPVSLRGVEPGQVGLARFIDLGNVDSAVSVVTQDLIVAREGGIELVGRQAGALARGCSLAVEALLEGGA